MFCFNVLDVVSIEKTGENFRLLYDVKGRFTVHRITGEEAKVSYKWSCNQANHQKFLLQFCNLYLLQNCKFWSRLMYWVAVITVVSSFKQLFACVSTILPQIFSLLEEENIWFQS